MSDRLHKDDSIDRALHPSAPFRQIAEKASYEEVIWAIELSDDDRRLNFAELVSRGPMSALDRESLARLSALVVVMQDRRSMGLA
jgi:hypothetical protein